MSHTRFSSIGLSGRKDQATNRTDAYKQILEIPITLVASTAEQSTGVILPSPCVVNSCVINVITAEVTGAVKTIDVGLLAGAPDSLANDALVSGVGFVPALTAVAGNGDEVTYSLAAPDFAELDAVILLEIIAG